MPHKSLAESIDALDFDRAMPTLEGCSRPTPRSGSGRTLIDS
jgi:hypothetical protein